MITKICERKHQRARLPSPATVVAFRYKTGGQDTHHGDDADQDQSAAQVGVLVVFGLAVGIVDNFQDQLLLRPVRNTHT